MILPKTWIVRKIEDIYDVLGGGTPSTSVKEFWDGSIPWITSADISEDNKIHPRKYVSEKGINNSAANLVPSNSIIVATRVGLGKVGITDVSTSFSQDCQGLVPKFKGFPSFNYSTLALRVLTQAFLHQSRGTTISGVTKKQLKELQIPLPPLPEQHRIVAKIEELFSDLDDGIASLKKVKEQLKTYRQSVLKWAFEGKLTNKNVIDGELPRKWKSECTKDLFEYVTSGSRGWARYYSDEGAIFLRMGNLDHDTIKLDLNDIQYVKLPNRAEGTRSLVQGGDILISITADVGMIALVPDGFSEAYINQHVALARPKRVKIDPSYLAWFLASKENGQKQLRNLQRGATKVGLGLDDIRSVVVPIPPLPEQSAIVSEIESRLSLADNLEKTIDSALTQSSALRQSILKRAFEGKLVPQDPNDEPAGKLLERIRAEQEKITNKKRSGS